MRGITHDHDPSHPADRVHQHRPHDHPLQLADPAHRRAGDGGSRRPVRRVVWLDPGPRHRHVRALRPAVAAAGLAGAALRPQDPDDRVLPGHGRWPDRRRSRSFPHDAGRRPGVRRRFRRDLSPDRDDNADRGRRRQTRPLHRRERRVRQPGGRAGPGRNRLPGQRRRLARRLHRPRRVLRRRRALVDAHAARSGQLACQPPARSRRSPAIWCAEPCWC